MVPTLEVCVELFDPARKAENPVRFAFYIFFIKLFLFEAGLVRNSAVAAGGRRCSN
jgi:hypothetical protein